MTQVYNFGAGPAMLPAEVMKKAQAEFLDYQGMGAGVIEISHRSDEFDAVLNRCDELLKELAGIPDNYKILYVHGGAQMQFSAVPLNLLGLSETKSASYIETGTWGVKHVKKPRAMVTLPPQQAAQRRVLTASLNLMSRAYRQTRLIYTSPVTTRFTARGGTAFRRPALFLWSQT